MTIFLSIHGINLCYILPNKVHQADSGLPSLRRLGQRLMETMRLLKVAGLLRSSDSSQELLLKATTRAGTGRPPMKPGVSFLKLDGSKYVIMAGTPVLQIHTLLATASLPVMLTLFSASTISSTKTAHSELDFTR